MKQFLILIAGYLVLQGSASCFADDDSPWTLATVSGYVDDAQGALAAAAGKVGQFKPSGNPLLKGQGNRSARKALANQINALTKGVADTDAKLSLGKLSVALTMADTGSKVAGSLSAGDLSGAGAVVVDEGVKTLSTAAGAFAGAESLALAGSFFGPVGTVIGGAVGAAGGAVLGSVGYDLTVGDHLKNAIESGMVGYKTKADYVNDARDSRKAHLANETGNARRKADDDAKQKQFDVKGKVGAARNRDAGYDPPNGAEVTLGGGPTTNPPLLPAANEPGKEMPQDVSIPVIPVDRKPSESFFFQGSDVPKGWKKSRSGSADEQFRPRFFGADNITYGIVGQQNIKFFTDNMTEVLYPSGQIDHLVIADGRTADPGGSYVNCNITIHPRIYYKDLDHVDSLLKYIQSGIYGQSHYIGSFDGEGVDLGGVFTHGGGINSATYYHILFFKGNWSIEIHMDSASKEYMADRASMYARGGIKKYVSQVPVSEPFARKIALIVSEKIPEGKPMFMGKEVMVKGNAIK